MDASWVELELTSLNGLKVCLEELRHDLEYYGARTARCKRCYSLVQHPGIGHANDAYLMPTWDRFKA